MKAVLVLLGAVSADISKDFDAYKAKFGKKYASPEAEDKAKSCWKQTVKDIEVHQAANDMAHFDENAFSDMCWEDFSHKRLGAKFSTTKMPRHVSPTTHQEALKVLRASPSVDWRKLGAVAPIQDQAHCGSCWAFGSVANIESQNFLWGPRNGTFVKLSEQELISCDDFKDKTGSDQGCQGGWPDRAFKWMMQNDGLTTEDNYPYTSGDGQTGTCDKHKEMPKAFNIVGYHDLSANETYVAAYVAKYGAVAIGLDATSSWHSYKSGIVTANCGSKEADHGVAIVGYGTESGQDYWLIRNSWGDDWGEQGYIRLKRGVNCNGVVGNVASALFGERSLCLQECGSGSCCGGDCCATQTGKEKCCADPFFPATPTGCAHEGLECCGREGGFYPCEDSSKCCSGTCCDGDSQCLTDGKTSEVNCCSKDQQCGSNPAHCCNGLNDKCCMATDPKYIGQGSCMRVQDNCCASGISCNMLDTCCGDKCCRFTEEECVAGQCVKSATNATTMV